VGRGIPRTPRSYREHVSLLPDRDNASASSTRVNCTNQNIRQDSDSANNRILGEPECRAEYARMQKKETSARGNVSPSAAEADAIHALRFPAPGVSLYFLADSAESGNRRRAF